MRTFTIFSVLSTFAFSAIASTIPPLSTVPEPAVYNNPQVVEIVAKPDVKARDITATTFAGIINNLISGMSEHVKVLGYINTENYTMNTVKYSFDGMNQAFSNAATSLNALNGQDVATTFQTIDNPTASLSSNQVADLVGNALNVALSAVGNANSVATASQLASTLPVLLSLAANITTFLSGVVNLADQAFPNFVASFSIVLQACVVVAVKQMVYFLGKFIATSILL